MLVTSEVGQSRIFYILRFILAKNSKSASLINMLSFLLTRSPAVGESNIFFWNTQAKLGV